MQRRTRFPSPTRSNSPAKSGSILASHTMQRSAIPFHYYAIFAIYEPFLTTIGFIGALIDPKGAHDQQAPWPNGRPLDFPLATKLTITQLGHVCALLGLLNVFLLSSARTHLSLQPALQEKIVSALLTPLLLGDVLHIYITLWALGDSRFDFANWTPTLYITIVSGLTLLIPRQQAIRAPPPRSSHNGNAPWIPYIILRFK
uniref:DUF7704 domain-containing protein n=1 Tax=Mycena chlorophos TaxID=658473 RepID=A0ABQ0M868_MYCCL|nr:predicted protein [Mycena chlorophos]